MRKTLLTFCLCVSTVLGAVGAPYTGAQKHKSLLPTSDSEIIVGPMASAVVADGQMSMLPSRAESQSESIDFTLADEPYSALSLKNVAVRGEFAGAFELTAENATLFAGAQITAINVCSGVNQSTNTNRILDVNVFITEDLQSAPVYEQAGKLGSGAFTYYSIQLATPYTIEAGKAVYIGFSGKKKYSSDFYLTIDGIEHNGEEGGWVASKNKTTGKWSWSNVSDDYGYLCLGATITGSNLPQDMASAMSLVVPSGVDINKPFPLGFVLRNCAANPIENVEVSYKIGGAAPVVKTISFPEALISCKSAVAEINDAVCAEVGKEVPVEFTVTKVNGKVNDRSDNTASGVLMCFGAEGGFQRRLVIEEGTGTWCGYCPLGMTTMEYIRDTYTDGTFIPIAAHSGDDMQCDAYVPFLRDYIPGLPGSMINREIKIDPRQMAQIIGIYEQLVDVPAFVGLEMVCDYADANKSSINFKATTTFAFDMANNNTYALSFVITEDGVGPYNQNNNYAGASGDYAGWESKPATVSLKFNDVARDIKTYVGLPNSVPASVSAYTPNEFYYTMSLESVDNPDNINAIALLINKNTNVIENAVMVKPSQFTGIDSVVDSASKAVAVRGVAGAIELAGDYNRAEVFSISGMKVAEASVVSTIEVPAGIYIVRVDGTAKKVIVK